ncbi:MAG: VOC family protein [Actinomycetota bacterium]
MISLAAITLDCADAIAIAEFWSSVLGRPVDQGPPAPNPFFTRILADDGGPMLMFIQVPEAKSVKNRVHLDFDADDREAEVARLIELGATHIHDKTEDGMTWTTLADPEGNEFCVGSGSP